MQWFTTEGNGFRTESIKLHLPKTEISKGTKTETTITQVNDTYKFDIKCVTPIYEGNIIIAIYDANNNIIATSIIKSNGSESYQADMTINNGKIAKIFTWDSMNSMMPLGMVEMLYIN